MENKIHEKLNILEAFEDEEDILKKFKEFDEIVCPKIEDLQIKIRQISDTISSLSIPKEKKQLMLYKYLWSVYTGIIGCDLAITGSIAVTKTILSGFENQLSLMEHETLSKIDGFSDKPSA